MKTIKLLNDVSYEVISVERRDHILEIRFKNPEDLISAKENLKLFKKIMLYNARGVWTSTCNNFYTLWKDDEYILYLSNDRSVYIKPEEVGGESDD